MQSYQRFQHIVHTAFNTPAPNRAHNGSHGETRAFRMGVVSLPSERFTRFGNPAWPGTRTANFAAFGSWPGGLPKNAESLRDSDALMRVAVPQAPRPRWAAWPFFVSVEITVFTLCAQGLSACARHGRYHYPRRALRAAETLDGRLSKRLTCRFLALPDSSLIPAAQNIVPFLYRCQKDQRDTRWSFHFCSHLLTCPDRPDRGT